MMILTVLIVTIVLLAGLVYCLKDWKEDTPVPPEKLYAGQLNEYEIRINDELKLNDFESDVSYKYSNILHKIFVLFNIDENNETVVIANYENPCRFIKFSDIIGYNIVEDSYVTGGIGRAVAGGLIAGGVGAIVGANTANKKAVDSFYIVIYTNSIRNPKVTTSLVNSCVKTDSNEYRNIVEFADNVGATLKAIISINNKQNAH